jgi:hypothetical protein
MRGGCHGDSHCVANFAAAFASLAAVGLWSATVLAVVRREQGRDVPPRIFRPCCRCTCKKSKALRVTSSESSDFSHHLLTRSLISEHVATGLTKTDTACLVRTKQLMTDKVIMPQAGCKERNICSNICVDFEGRAVGIRLEVTDES